MTFPSFVTRAAMRIALGGAVAAAAIAVAALVIERTALGSDLAASRARLRAEVEGEFAVLSSRLDQAMRAVTVDVETLRRAERGDAAATRVLFDAVGSGVTQTGVPITIYGANNEPVAWLGRSEEVPPERLSGPAATFLAQSSQGLQLVRVQPIADPAEPTRHIGAVVAEAQLPRTGDALPGSEFSLETSIVPVALRRQFEGAADAGADAFVVQSPTKEPLAAVLVSDADLRAARERIRQRAYAAELGLASLLVLLLAGPLLDWRRLTRSTGAATILTIAIALDVIAARAMAWIAVRKGGLAEFSLLPEAPWTRFAHVMFASPIDFLLNALVIAALVVLAVTSFTMWRGAHRPGLGVVVVDRVSRSFLFWAVQLAAGFAITALVMLYAWLLRTHVSQTPVDIVRFSLDRLDPIRLPVIVGLIALNAAVVGVAILLCRLAWSPWVFPGRQLLWRSRALMAWMLPGIVAFGVLAADDRAPQWPSVLIVISAAAAAWLLDRYRFVGRHGSQALKLLMSFLAVALPSIVLYPSLVDAAERARRQLIETRYAPEVSHQRQELRAKIQKALAEIDRIVALDDLARASDAPLSGPPPADAAFLIWSQTSLATERLTSSVELHNSSGAMVSRFAMNLPDFTQPQPWSEQSCKWEELEEVSPLFSEERRLLHAGKALCVGGRRAGSVVVHSMLDYGNLSFVSAQNPYEALARSQSRAQPRPRAEVEFYVYGWSRRVLYTSVQDAPPLPEGAFRRAYQSRTPFWTTIRRGADSRDAFFLSDRGAIYVLTSERQNAFGHLVAEAELLALAFLVFVAAVIGNMTFNLLAGRAPASGRALFAEVRASFYRKLFLAFVAAAIVPVLALALVSRQYTANVMLADIESEATRLATVASRVFEDLRGFVGQAAVADDLIVWLSRVVAQDVNIFDGPTLLASSERNLFASGLLPSRTPGEVYRAIFIEGRPSFVGRERAGGLEYLIAATPVQIQGREAVLTIPLASRQQEMQAQIEELDRRVLLAAVLFIMLGAGIGYYMAERIADPVNRLMRATRRIARGDLDARVLATSSDELRRLVDAFNQMADDLQRQRGELERTNRLAAWADMARQVAHDIKNPLTPIQLNAEHLRRVHLDRGKPMGNVIDECVGNILGQVRLLRQISSEFSSFATSPEPRPVDTNLGELVEEVVEPYRSGLADRVTIDTHVPASLPGVSIDRTLIGRALTNIIENALHAMPNGGTLTIDAALAPDHMVQLRVTDTGIGMDDLAIAKIFEPYFSTKAIGTGLGLTIAKRNVEANRGTIAVTSQKGHGTSVTMTLPQI
ncbi:MAG: HAMP domain-containing protein [Cyanobacteria bacterium]|nr:HAMP domain-containing protein [Cyanobacteriota bacterium]